LIKVVKNSLGNDRNNFLGQSPREAPPQTGEVTSGFLKRSFADAGLWLLEKLLNTKLPL